MAGISLQYTLFHLCLSIFRERGTHHQKDSLFHCWMAPMFIKLFLLQCYEDELRAVHFCLLKLHKIYHMVLLQYSSLCMCVEFPHRHTHTIVHTEPQSLLFSS